MGRWRSGRKSAKHPDLSIIELTVTHGEDPDRQAHIADLIQPYTSKPTEPIDDAGDGLPIAGSQTA